MTLEINIQRRLGQFQVDAQFASDGGITALFGRSGAGKSSLIRMISGLLRPQRGRIVVNGQVLFDGQKGINVPTRQRRLGYVFQDARLFPHLNVRQNLLYGRWFTPRAERYAAFQQVVDLLGIEDLLGRRPGMLSGGEKQRVAIGRALLASPQLLLLDEPLASLDAARKAEILPYIERLRDELRLPTVYVSHALEEITRLATTLVLISDGRVAAMGSAQQLMSRLDLRPLTGRYEAGAVIEAHVVSHNNDYGLTTLAFAGGHLQVPQVDQTLGSTIRARVRARDVAVARQPLREVSIRNQIPAQIVEISTESGPFAEVHLDANGTALVARVMRLTVDELQLQSGDTVYALIKSVAMDRHSLGLPATHDSAYLTALL
jgi:molybdate transport system ATP-binding protein